MAGDVATTGTTGAGVTPALPAQHEQDAAVGEATVVAPDEAVPVTATHSPGNGPQPSTGPQPVLARNPVLALSLVLVLSLVLTRNPGPPPRLAGPQRPARARAQGSAGLRRLAGPRSAGDSPGWAHLAEVG